MKDKTHLTINSFTKIPVGELVFKFTRSGGPGGQNVNKVNTKVSLSFDVERSGSLDENQKKLIMNKLANRISASGILLVVASEHRTQQANKVAAIERLENLLSQSLRQTKKRHKTKPTRSSKEKRLKTKLQRSILKKQRKSIRDDKY